MKAKEKKIIDSEDFYFQKGTDTLKNWIDYDLDDERKKRLYESIRDYEKFSDLKVGDEFFNVKELLFEIVSYCDFHARNKKIYNKYEDTRVLAKAGVRMQPWVNHLLNYKFDNKKTNVTVKNALDMLIDPINNINSIAVSHRNLISNYYLKKSYDPKTFVNDLKEHFKDLPKTKNAKNETVLISSRLYSEKTKWENKISSFEEFKKNLKHYIQENNLDYKIGKKGRKEKWFWISDNDGNFSNKYIHYEFILNKNNTDEVEIDLHFEEDGERAKKNRIIIGELPDFLEWKEWEEWGNSISHKTKINLKDIDVLETAILLLNELYDYTFPLLKEEQNKETIVKIDESNPMKSTVSLNTILYGPPGTGKTYNTINKAVAIANPDFVINDNRKALKDEYNRLVKDGQIVFTTFHQSMSYEDFVEGIKPVIEENDIGDKTIIYEVKDGIFKELAERANNARLNQNNRSEGYGFDDAWNELIREINQSYEENKQFVLDVQTPKLGMDVKSISGKGNLNLKPIYSENAGDYTVSYSRARKLHEAFPDLSIVKNIDKEFRSVIGGSNSTAYWAVLNYINLLVADNKSKTIIERKSELSAKPHVLIIDEINRGNISQIFGELITLIEEDKRLGNDEAIEVTLPYSKTKFGVPPNLYIIGTMNTADRSVEALDSALRRRFVFEELMPKYEGIKELDYSVYGFQAGEILQTINKRIEILLDKDHQIGHAYFLNKDEQSIITSFYKNIIPLLQEYFFGDYGKIGLVLGKGFVDTLSTKNEFADFVYEDVDMYNDVKRYSIIDYRVPNKVGTFENAIEKLMNIAKS